MTAAPTDTDATPPGGPSRRLAFGRFVDSLPGQLLMVTVGLIAVGVVLVYFPATASFRMHWMSDRVATAHLATLAADVSTGGGLGEDQVRILLMGADAVAVSRVRDGRNELILHSGPIGEKLVESDLRKAGWFRHIRDTIDTLLAPPGRLLRIRAAPYGHTGEVIDVIVHEEPLKRALEDFSRRLLLYAFFAALVVGIVVYAALFQLFVRPMRRLAVAMTRFRTAPEDPRNTVQPSGVRNEIGQAEEELALMQADIRHALHQRERLAELGAAVAKINHDLRNVLASAHLVSDRLAMAEDERVRNMGERLVRAIDRGIRLCEATLQFGRADESEPVRRPVAARGLLDEVAVDAILTEGEVEWRNQIDGGLVLDVDPDQAHRLLLNICRNAIQAMQATAGGRCLQARGRREDGLAVIEIEDSGPGLPSRARENLFRAFSSSTRQGGTGLGLSIARELARAHGGDVTLVSSNGTGTVFAVWLPVAD